MSGFHPAAESNLTKAVWAYGRRLAILVFLGTSLTASLHCQSPIGHSLPRPNPSWLPNVLLSPRTHQASQHQRRKRKQHSPTATTGSPRHIFWVVPAFNVTYQEKFEPLTPREKFDEWLDGTYDPRGLGFYAAESATLEYSSSDGFCGYGKGWGGYGECFGSMELDAATSSFLGDFLFPVVMHQDPRYFRLGSGSFGKRVWHAISRVFVTYNDSGHTVFYASAISGTFIAAGLSNLYYPPQDVGFSQTMSRAATDLGNTALFNLAAEFWPNIDHGIHHIFRTYLSPQKEKPHGVRRDLRFCGDGR